MPPRNPLAISTRSLRVSRPPEPARREPVNTANPSRVRYRQVELAGHRVGLLTAGPPEASPLFLLHGFSGDALTWQFNVGALAKHHRVTAIDLPGHGMTEAPGHIGYWRGMVAWVAEIASALELPPAHYAGHSLGARILLGALEEGKLAALSLSLISCAGISPSYNFAFLERLSQIETMEDAIACVVTLLGDASDPPERLAKGLFQKLSTSPAKAGLKAYLASNFAEGRLLPAAPVRWDALTCPLQIIWGTDDRIVQLPPSEWLPAGAAVHLLDRVGHLPHITAADRINGLLIAHADCRAMA